MGLRSLVVAAIVGLVAAPSASAMNYERVKLVDRSLCTSAGCPEVIVATGRIANDSAERLVGFIEGQRDLRGMRRVMFIESPGGSVVGAMKLGRLLRQAKVDVYVAKPVGSGGVASDLSAARCYSACAFALLGGVQRYIPSGSEVGIHRASRHEYMTEPGGGTILAQRHRAEPELLVQLKSYIRSMGADPGLVAVAETVGADNIKVLSPAEIRRFRIGRQP